MRTMSLRQRRLAGLVLTFVVIAAAVAGVQPQSEAVHNFRVTFGLHDKQPTDWSGQVTVANGQVTALSGWHFEAKSDQIKGTSAWKSGTHDYVAPLQRYPIQDYAGKPKAKPVEQPWPIGVYLSVRGNAPAVTVQAGKEGFKFAAAEVLLGEPKDFGDGNVRVERVAQHSAPRGPDSNKAENPVQDDYPAFWVRYKTGKHYVAWVAYQNARDRVLLAERNGPDGTWSAPIEVDGPGQHFRVALAGTHNDTLWIVFARQEHTNGPNVTGTWDLYGRPYKDGKLGKEIRLTGGAGPNLWHRMTTDQRGRAWLVWQGFQGGQSDIFARCADGDVWHAPIKVSTSKANDWDPCIAADPKEDRVWIGWDTYDPGNYSIRVRSLSGGPAPKLGEVFAPAGHRQLFSAHVSLACDRDGRLWAAWDESGPQWGKDTGFLYGGSARMDTTRLYASRALRIACLVDGAWQKPVAEFDANLPPLMQEYNELPQLQGDSEGRIWLAWRHRTCRRPRADGWAAQGRWDSYATAFLGDRWLAPIELPHSDGRIDMRFDSQRDRDGAVYFAYATDNRGWSPPGMPPHNHNVNVSRLSGAAQPGPARFQPLHLSDERVPPVHPNEGEQVARIRSYKVEAGGKTYRIYRGDLHRHTDISGDGPGDGSVTDLHRYALDAAALDYVMVGDHNMGQDNEYCWWRTQQFNDLYTVPGAFISMYGYERSVKYPNGHRNVIWPERGHRTLPLPKPVPAALKGDTARLYAYLKRTGGICTLHTSATDQGTDWADPHDAALEPFVEIFQGYHTSYEAPGAPKAIVPKSDMIHGPYKGDGYVSFALDKGYHLGFQASSDHISTHVSYACILAEEFSRKGLVEAMRKRHSYAATDNIVLDVRMGTNLMGDEVRTPRPAVDVVVLGTAPLDKVEVIRNGSIVHTYRPAAGAAEARFLWPDPAPVKGERASYYYVRVVQKNGEMAWASPIWVTVGN
jgi:hypothetical protein